MSNNVILECRVRKSEWLAVAMTAGMGTVCTAFLLFTNMSPADRKACLVMTAFCWIVALIAAVYLARTAIIADEDGIRWRSLMGWRSCKWNEVLDFYHSPVPRKRSTTIIKTSAGTLTAGSSLDNLQQLRELVQRKAVHAKARSWGTLGARPEDDWPQVFHYNTFGNRYGNVLYNIFAFTLFAAIGWEMLPKAVESASYLGWFWSLLPVFFLWIMCSFYFVVPFALRHVGLDLRKRKQHRIIVNPNGITFEDGKTSRYTAWSEVNNYYTLPFKGLFNVPGRHIIETDARVLEFSHLITRSFQLKAIIQRFANNAVSTAWHCYDGEILGDEHSRWSYSETGERVHIYHYRTRTNRAMLWLLSSIPLILATGWLLLRVLGIRSMNLAETIVFGTFTVILMLLAAWSWICYWKSSIHITESAITQYTPFGSKRIRWDEVRDYQLKMNDPMSCWVLQGTSNSIRIRFYSAIADAEALRREVEKHISRQQVY